MPGSPGFDLIVGDAFQASPPLPWSSRTAAH
jgi:hypothetical protein